MHTTSRGIRIVKPKHKRWHAGAGPKVSGSGAYAVALLCVFFFHVTELTRQAY